MGKWELFDSPEIEDHHQAAHLCKTACDLLEWCKQELQDALASAHYKGYGPAGTWAGAYVDRSGVIDPETVARRPKRRVAACGTLSGYKRHLRLKEETCRECRDAVTRSNKERKARKRAEREAS